METTFGPRKADRLHRPLPVFLALALVMGFAFPAAANIGFECDPPGIEIADDYCQFFLGDTVNVYVTVDASVVDMRGMSLVLEYDPAIVSVESVTMGPLIPSFCPANTILVNSVAGDSIDVDVAGLGCSADGPGRVICIQFIGTALGISPLDCRQLILRDSLNQNIPCECPGGFLEVIEEPTPAKLTTWGYVKRNF